MNVQIEESWKAHLQPEFEKDYFRTLTEFVKSEYSQYTIYPPGKLIFNAFNLCPFDKVKVVIIGQDPYLQSPNQKIPDRKTKCVIETHLNIKQNVIFGANLKPV